MADATGPCAVLRDQVARHRQAPTVGCGGAAITDFHRGSTASRSGSGLGLALVAQQAEIHGGTAALEVSPMGGTRLILRLQGSGPH